MLPSSALKSEFRGGDEHEKARSGRAEGDEEGDHRPVRDDETDRMRLSDEWGAWCWMCRYRGGEYDFSDEEEFRRGINLFTEMVRKRYSRARPNTPVIARGQFAWRSILFRLKAKFNIREIAEEEVKATGWDRSEYAE